MAEYISKQKAKNLMGCCLASAKAEYKAAKDDFTKARFEDYISAIQAMIDVVGAVEAADVQPVKRGKWIEIAGYGGWSNSEFKCPECGITEYKPTNFCPNCGAELRGIDNG